MKARSGNLIKRGKVWSVRWMVNGKVYTKTTGETDKNKARAAANIILEPFAVGNEATVLENVVTKLTGRKAELARLEDEQNPPLAIRDAFRAYEQAGNRREIADVTMRSYVSIWKAFTEWLADTHPDIDTLQAVTFDICEEYKTNMQRRKVTPRTFNANRAFLRSFWNVLAEKAKTAGNPWARLAKRDETPQGRRALTVDELRAVCGSAGGELRTMLAFGLYLGCRLADAACMDWGSVDMARRMICYLPSKTARKIKTSLKIPMHPELFAILDETPKADRRGPVCTDMAQRYHSRGADGCSDIIQKHFEACGLSTTTERKGAGIRRSVEVGFHSLRHTAVSLIRDAGAAQSISQAIVGHNDAAVHALYTHPDEIAMRRAVDSLPTFTGVKALPPPTDPASERAEALRGRILELAEQLTVDNVEEIRTLLKQAAV